MKFNRMSLLALFFCHIASASLARYSYHAKCYDLSPNGDLLIINLLGRVDGYSNYDCANAYQNLMENCDQIAQQRGFNSGSVYKDILTVGKSFSRSSSSSSTESGSHSSQAAAALFIWGLKNSNSYANSYSNTNTEAGSSQVNYIPVDEEKSCIINRHIPQANVPLVNLGNNFH